MITSFIFWAFLVEITAKIYFKEEFSDGNWHKRWIVSEHRHKNWGKFILSPGRYYGDPEISKGIQTTEDEKFYGLTTKFEPFSNKDKVLIIQFSVKFEQDVKCAGGYVKLFDCSFNPKKFHSYIPYLIQFGPDICGYKKIHVIFNYEDRKLPIKKQIKCKDDHLTHLYTLIIKPDNTYLIKIDNKIERSGILEDDWDFLPPKKINGTKAIKGKDWDNDPKITYTIQEQSRTEAEFYFTDVMEQINENPEPEMTENLGNDTGDLNYKEQSIEVVIEKPVYLSNLDFYRYDEICGIGFDLWQVESGTLFDNILITDDELIAEQHGNNTWGAIKEKEKIKRIKYNKLIGREIESHKIDIKHEHDEL